MSNTSFPYSVREQQQNALLIRAMIRGWRLAQAEARALIASPPECICGGCTGVK